MSKQKRYAYLIGANSPQTEYLTALKYEEISKKRAGDTFTCKR